MHKLARIVLVLTAAGVAGTAKAADVADAAGAATSSGAAQTAQAQTAAQMEATIQETEAGLAAAAQAVQAAKGTPAEAAKPGRAKYGDITLKRGYVEQAGGMDDITMKRGVDKTPDAPKADIAARPLLLTPLDIGGKTPGAGPVGRPGVALTPLSPTPPVKDLPRAGAPKERPDAPPMVKKPERIDMPPMVKQPVAVTPGPIKLPPDRPLPVLAPVKIEPVVVQPPVMVKPVQPVLAPMPAKPLTR